jgi:hypothetical protein
LVLGLSTSPARADGEKQRCVAAFEEGQRSKMAGDLQRAVEEFDSCAASSCPAAAQRECSRLRDVTQSVIPSVQFELRFRTDFSKRPVLLSVDGAEPRAYDGEVLRLNPGKHRFVFECEGCAPVTRRIAFSEQDSKRKEVVLKPAAGDAKAAAISATPRAQTQPASCPPCAISGTGPSSKTARAALSTLRESEAERTRLRDIILIGSAATLAAAGGVGFVGFGLRARNAEHALLDCTPYCSRQRIADVKQSYWFANASLGVGVLALGSATIWWFSVRRSPSTAGSHAGSPSQWSIELGPINRVTRTF